MVLDVLCRLFGFGFGFVFVSVSGFFYFVCCRLLLCCHICWFFCLFFGGSVLDCWLMMFDNDWLLRIYDR